MSLTPPTNRAPSTLAEVVRALRYYMREAGDATPIMVGKNYLERGVGSSPRIVLIPEVRGSIGASLIQGNAASRTHGCDVLVRGAESGDDEGRFDAADALSDKFVSAIRRACTGKLEFGDCKDTSPADVDLFGAELTYSFTWTRDIRKDPDIYAVAPVPASIIDPFYNDAPIAVPGVVTVSVTTIAEV